MCCQVEAKKPRRTPMTMSDSIPLVIHVEQAPSAEAAIAEQTLSLNDPPGQLAQRSPHPSPTTYHRYQIETGTVPDIVPLPPKFRVKVKKHRLVGMVLKELIPLKRDIPVPLTPPSLHAPLSPPFP